METEHNKIASGSDGKCLKMTKICSRSNIPWGIATRFRRSHWRRYAYHRQKKMAVIGYILFEQIGPKGVVQTRSSFGCQGHPKSLRMVPFDRRQNVLYFPCPGPYACLPSLWSFGKKRNGNVPRKIEVEIVHLQPWRNRMVTRSSAIAQEPRDASCQLKSSQLPSNSAETTCTTSPEQIEVMKLEG